MSEAFYIGELSRRTRVAVRTIRYYEHAGLLPKPQRSATGYRLYSEEHVHGLRFIAQAKLFGLSLQEIRDLLELSASGQAPCAQLIRLVRRRIDEFDLRIREMTQFRDELSRRLDQAQLGEPSGRICGIIERTDLPARDL
ncbi:MAG: MerR family transcriptional regulator [Bacillota bacterium]